MSLNFSAFEGKNIFKFAKYEIKEITPFDMFPNTKNVETFVLLKLKENLWL